MIVLGAALVAVAKPEPHLAVATVAVALARQPVARSLTVAEVAADAVRLAGLALALRRSLERQRPERDEVALASEIAKRYGAKVVAQRDVEGSVLALRFPAGTHVAGFRNLVFVA